MSNPTLSLTVGAVIRGAGFDLGALPIPEFVSGATPFLTQVVALSGANTTVAAPTLPNGATLSYALLVADPTATSIKTIKGASGDAGIPLGAKFAFALIPLDATFASLVIGTATPSATDKVTIYWL
jgi:hypothetical protein